MSLLSAGKQISLGNDNSFGRGLFVIDPDEAERKARKQLEYQEQLRAQMEEARRRKMQQKKKEDDEDKRWEQKFKQQVKKQSQKKNEKPQQINDKNFNNFNNNNNKTQKSQVTIRPDFHKEQVRNARKTQQHQEYSYNIRKPTETQTYDNHYIPKIINYQYSQDQHFYQESSQQKLKLMREVLDEKMNEVYSKIKQSKNLQIDREIQNIRKKINSSNNSYESQNPKITQLPHQFSQFYKIPKKNTYGSPQVKNLDYDSRVEYKRNDHSSNNRHYPSRQKDNQSINSGYNPIFQNNIASRGQQSQSGQDERKWGINKGKTNFLGNRQALDYQIQNILNSIDNNLIQHGQN